MYMSDAFAAHLLDMPILVDEKLDAVEVSATVPLFQEILPGLVRILGVDNSMSSLLVKADHVMFGEQDANESDDLNLPSVVGAAIPISGEVDLLQLLEQQMTSRQSVCKAAQTAGDVSDWIAQMVEEDVEQDPDDEDITASEIATHPPAEETSETGEKTTTAEQTSSFETKQVLGYLWTKQLLKKHGKPIPSKFQTIKHQGQVVKGAILEEWVVGSIEVSASSAKTAKHVAVIADGGSDDDNVAAETFDVA
ncbi:Uncharacterized protein SCF082_LOCUS47201 [Durusdinium trenchii]|uniref:Uncharacterized protein n=1 Tax=Durusdinium trenchii TaxID=1381693 RepID=A0ABP0RN08_9DINO